jgi:hypothetical protein
VSAVDPLTREEGFTRDLARTQAIIATLYGGDEDAYVHHFFAEPNAEYTPQVSQLLSMSFCLRTVSGATAAEFSRELGEKIFRGKADLFSLGSGWEVLPATDSAHAVRQRQTRANLETWRTKEPVGVYTIVSTGVTENVIMFLSFIDSDRMPFPVDVIKVGDVNSSRAKVS